MPEGGVANERKEGNVSKVEKSKKKMIDKKWAKRGRKGRSGELAKDFLSQHMSRGILAAKESRKTEN